MLGESGGIERKGLFENESVSDYAVWYRTNAFCSWNLRMVLHNSHPKCCFLLVHSRLRMPFSQVLNSWKEGTGNAWVGPMKYECY